MSCVATHIYVHNLFIRFWHRCAKVHSEQRHAFAIHIISVYINMHYAKSTKEVFAESVVSSKMQFSSVQLHFIIHIHLPVRRKLPDGDYGGAQHNQHKKKRYVLQPMVLKQWMPPATDRPDGRQPSPTPTLALFAVEWRPGDI